MICDICGQAFTAANDFYVHYLTHDNSSLRKCVVCEAEFSGVGEVRKHICNVHISDAILRSSPQLRNLVKKCNKEEGAADPSGSEVPVCSPDSEVNAEKKSGPSQGEKRRRGRPKNSKNKPKVPKSQKEERLRGAYRCQLCKRHFHDQELYDIHTSRHEIKGHFTCETCGKEFRGKIFYKVHLMSHKEQKPFKCEKCPEIFLDIVAFKRHIGGHKCEHKERRIRHKVRIIKSRLKEKLVAS